MPPKQGPAPWNANLLIRRRTAGGQPTNPEIGIPSGPTKNPPKGWRSRGYLPHFDSATITQAVTLHLADSLPKEVLQKLQAEIDLLPESEQNLERRKRIEAYADAGHGCCILRHPAIAHMVQKAFLHFHAQRYTLRAWVIMPNHFHILFKPEGGWSLHGILASWKKFTGRRINDHWRAHPNTAPKNWPQRNANLPIRRRTAGHKNANQEIDVPNAIPTPPPNPVWHPEFFDRYIRDQDHFQKSVRYIHQNPVKAGLVARAEDWPWSSAAPWNANLPIRPAPPHGTRIS